MKNRLLLVVLACAAALTGCSRRHYFIRADRETYGTLAEKTAGRPWMPSPGFNILPHPSSRLFDPTPVVDPLLEDPAPKLYAYQIPELPQRDKSRFRQSKGSTRQLDLSLAPSVKSAKRRGGYVPATLALGTPQPLTKTRPPSRMGKRRRSRAVEPTPMSSVRQVAFQPSQGNGNGYGQDGTEEIRINPLPEEAWSAIPARCLRRMFEFRSVRDEYEKTFSKQPDPSLLDPSKRLTFEDIVQLAVLNSRELQTEKEKLYLAALALTLERFQYDLKFTPFNNGTVVDYIHNRTAGITTNTLGIPTQFNMDKILATGGSLLARFANNVVLTFNGPQGFTSDVSSELLFEVTQAVLQRDIVFEKLTQAERNVVYAARDYARFRKTFFRDLAFQYYSLITTYRNIEISAQNYFSNLRAFALLEAEFRQGRRSRIQVDQTEQQVLSSRNSLIGVCNTLESNLDALKVSMGLPPETRLNLDLTELEEITLRDQVTVSIELVRRAVRNLRQDRSEDVLDRESLVNGSIDLARRMLEALDLRKELGVSDLGRPSLERTLAGLLVDQAELQAEFNRKALAEGKAKKPPVPPVLILQRTNALIESLLLQVSRQVELARLEGIAPGKLQPLLQSREVLNKRLRAVIEDLDKAVAKRELNRIPAIVKASEAVLADAEKLVRDGNRLLGRPEMTRGQRLQKTVGDADRLLAAGQKLVSADDFGLQPVELSFDEGMVTAVTQRYDLMNLRGIEADEWRRIKLAGDDLKSVLNLKATQVLRTDSRHNRPFDFTFDDSETRLNLAFDAPLNRKAQRNAFRVALINYQAARRNRMALEDAIKLAVRDILRALDLDREQYRIAVSSAALAYERVLSTRLQLQLGRAGVTARDFNEAQQAYAQSLSQVASRHIGYLQDRISLFLNLELLVLDDEGFWPELYDESYRPEPQYALPPVPPYGVLPRGVWYSHKVKRMLRYGPGPAVIYEPETSTPAASPGPESLPPPRPVPQSGASVRPAAVLGRPRVATPPSGSYR